MDPIECATTMAGSFAPTASRTARASSAKLSTVGRSPVGRRLRPWPGRSKRTTRWVGARAPAWAVDEEHRRALLAVGLDEELLAFDRADRHVERSFLVRRPRRARRASPA